MAMRGGGPQAKEAVWFGYHEGLALAACLLKYSKIAPNSLLREIIP